MFRILGLVAISLVSMIHGAIADIPSRATMAEAKAMAERVTALEREVAASDAAARFAARGGTWPDRDLYIVMQDSEVGRLSHPFTPAPVGKNMRRLRDIDGTQFIEIIQTLTHAAGVGVKWSHPDSGKIKDKSFYAIQVDGNVVIVSAYRSSNTEPSLISETVS